MPESMRVVDRVEQIPRDDWQRLASEQPPLRFEVLEAITNQPDRSVPLRIFLLEDENGLVAAAICEPVNANTPGSLDSLLFGRALRGLRKLGISTRPSLLFQLPLGTGSPVLTRCGDDTERRRVLRKLFHGIEEHAAAHRFGVAFIGVPDIDGLLMRVLREHGYVGTEIQPTAKLEIEWPDFAGYLGHLRKRGKGAAETVRNERNRNRKSGIRIRHVPDESVDADALYAVARDHYRHKNGRDPFEGPQFLPRLRQHIGADFLAFQAERGDEVVASLVVVRFGCVGWVSWLGFQARDRPNDFTYVNLCYYELAERAPALGLKTLLYGNGALQAKRKRGCIVTTNHLFYRPHWWLWRLAIRPYFAIHRAWYRRKLR